MGALKRDIHLRAMVSGLAVALLAGLAIAPAVHPATVYANDIANFTTVFGTDVVHAGFGGMRDDGTGTLTVGGVSGTVTKAYLYWHGPTNSTDPAANAAVMFAGNAVTGTNIGFSSDNCWGFLNSQAYRADVTSFVTGNGSFTLAGFVKDSPNINVNGASLIVFFDDGNAANNRDVVLFDGNDSNTPNTFDANGWNVSLPGINYVSGTAAITMHVSDGQSFEDDALVLNASTLAPAGPIFQGDSVPFGSFDADGHLWDIKSFDVTSFLSPGPNTLTLTTGHLSDCLSLVVAAIDLPAGAAPPNPAHLTLAKSVDNTGGGTALATAWTLGATGPTTISGHTGDASITNAAVDAGTYTLAESGGPTGYAASAWSCTGGTLTGSSLVLAAGETASCSITNTFVPPNPAHLTLAKSVDNTGGGTALATAWTLGATGPTTISGHTGDASITNAAVDAGTYTLAESGGPTGYAASAWSCTGGTLTGSSLVLAAGETASCSITNTFVPVARVGLIAPTDTTCEQYVAGTAPTLPGINYTVNGGKIGQNINPGVFFYFSTVTVTAGQTVTTSQSTTNSSGALFLLNNGHSFIWDSNCKKVGNMASADGGATGSFTFPTAGTYILQLQYQTKSIAGTAAPSPINPTYTFDTAIGGVEFVPDTTSISLFNK